MALFCLFWSMQLKKYCLSLPALCLVLSSVSGQEFFKPSAQYNPGRVNGTIIVESAIGTAVTIGLNYLWYKKFPHSRFHYFNDNNEWLNVDKVGHATTAYNKADIQSDVLRWGHALQYRRLSAVLSTAAALEPATHQS